MKTPHLKKEDQIKKKRQNRGGAPVVLDAKDIPFGRVATMAATMLIGKDDPQWSPFSDACSKVVVIKNLNQIHVTGNKMDGKKYHKHTGYYGNLKTSTFQESWAKSPQKTFRRAVYGMLPKNKLRDKIIKNLKFEL